MRKLFVSITALVLIVAGVSADNHKVRLERLKIFGQEQSTWCYAACAKMVASSMVTTYKSSTKQCELAEWAEGPTEDDKCCDHPAWCNGGGGAGSLLRDYLQFDVSGLESLEYQILDYNALEKELRSPRKNGDTAPVVTTFFSMTDQMHAVIVRGVTTTGSNQYVYIIDPFPVADSNGTTPAQLRGGEPRKIKFSEYQYEQLQKPTEDGENGEEPKKREDITDFYGITAP